MARGSWLVDNWTTVALQQYSTVFRRLCDPNFNLQIGTACFSVVMLQSFLVKSRCAGLLLSRPAPYIERRFWSGHQAGSTGDDSRAIQSSPFHDACEQGDVETVISLLNKGVDVNAGDPSRANTTGLHLASRQGFVDLVYFLLEKNADVNSRGAWQLTPLMYSAVFDKPEVTSVLLEHGADMQLVDAKGKTALDHATSEQNFGVVAILQKHE